MAVPGFWMNETSGALAPVVIRYLDGHALAPEEIATMRAYLRQWIAGSFVGHDIDDLRTRIDEIIDMRSLNAWIEDAIDAGADPL